ncbi:hypothetical protein [Anatilimnocola floriformis]|uniref:hypothetical protein n=1 Tax=Anatilimnocola floriformis TaxID=2948575 RepID=UPI0020C533F5|nr:hypothetical protein [Anatilimnocola floriformis]
MFAGGVRKHSNSEVENIHERLARSELDAAAMRQYYLLLLCGFLFVGLGCENRSANNSAGMSATEYQRQIAEFDRQGEIAAKHQAETDRQLAESARQGAVTAKQQEEMQRQLEQAAKQADRMQKLIERWEGQADRQDKILERQERQLPQPKDTP